MLVDEFDYELPSEQIAQEPLADRAASRMLVVYRDEGRWEDRAFRDFPDYLNPGDCLIVNESKVFPSRLYGQRGSGVAQIEVFLIKPLDAQERTWQALVRPGRKVKVGQRIVFSETLAGEVLERGDHGLRVLRFETDDVIAALEAIGHVPLPPYIRREDTKQDRERYQTVFARQRGSVAAPTAGLHFTPEILAMCQKAGAVFAFLTLHVGLGTFAKLSSEKVEENVLHHEEFAIPTEAMNQIRLAQRRIAVGTTSVRAIESAYAGRQGETNLFIYPGYSFQAVDGLLTNFHLPKSSLLMLVCGFAGSDLTLRAYQHAVREGYRFFSYGDCMLVI